MNLRVSKNRRVVSNSKNLIFSSLQARKILIKMHTRSLSMIHLEVIVLRETLFHNKMWLLWNKLFERISFRLRKHKYCSNKKQGSSSLVITMHSRLVYTITNFMHEISNTLVKPLADSVKLSLWMRARNYTL